ncbi:SigB/SigF/SigG family RNA polymerase sigma factor [Jidongwangia harbinensis]|uniref:SigB/SigF/SigG family RNA polymerase sigma factor n=1 Tax=Jidongwangia harbinensis TaxID=2878561 RepID=UPI001CD9F5A2|nr:SigB/SigF/SigG family RNA polymerase sigma factor [Jidongwangia harbinensis]MCA2218800.1 SigB/SigF/SigG family RNA polymerase sigma factor [Jidongwangia harbinensis]
MTSEQGLEDLDAAALAYAARVSAGERAAAREELTRQCLPFAGRMARRYRGRGEQQDDLEQVARLGLVKAIDRYDPERGSFTAYAVITISGEIKRHFRDKTWGVHVPRRVQDLSLEVGHATMVLTTTLSRTPTAAELAAHLRVAEPAVREAQESSAGYTPASLNAPVAGEGSGELGDLLGGADRELESVDDKLTVSRLLLRLPARERQMLAMRFYGNRTQAEIAAELGISQMHVSRLLSRALGWLREAMLSDNPPSWEGNPCRDHPMQVSVHRGDGALTVRVRGEVDRDTAERLRIGLRHAVAAAGDDRLVVDLTGVPLVDAAGVAVLHDAAAAASVASVGLTIAGAQPFVARILGVSGLSALIPPS